MKKQFKLTKGKYEEIKQELYNLRTVKEREIAEQIKEARSHGDLSENSEYDEAKNEQGKLYSRMAELENILENAVIIDETARYFSISPDEIRGQRRSKNIAIARHVSIYLIRSLINLSLNDIGAIFEDRNHATILSSIRKIETMIKTEPEMSATIRDITSNINSRQR